MLPRFPFGTAAGLELGIVKQQGATDLAIALPFVEDAAQPDSGIVPPTPSQAGHSARLTQPPVSGWSSSRNSPSCGGCVCRAWSSGGAAGLTTPAGQQLRGWHCPSCGVSTYPGVGRRAIAGRDEVFVRWLVVTRALIHHTPPPDCYFQMSALLPHPDGYSMAATTTGLCDMWCGFGRPSQPSSPGLLLLDDASGDRPLPRGFAQCS